MTTQLPESLPPLLAALAFHERAADTIRNAIRVIRELDPQLISTKHKGKPIYVALVDELRERGEATRGELIKALEDGGCECGERPAANINTTITRNSAFICIGDRVRLREEIELAA